MVKVESYCPLIKDNCKGEQCAWWDGGCVVNIIADHIVELCFKS